MSATVASLWINGPLSYLEALCLQSFEKVGQKLVLYTYGDIPNCPPNIELRDAREIDPDDSFQVHGRAQSPALKSDAFRYMMLQKTDYIWVDADQLALAPFDYETDVVFCEMWGLVNNAVLRLPAESEIVADLIEMSREEYPVPFWLSEEEKTDLQAKKDAGIGVPAIEMEFGIYGPKLLGHLLIKHDLIKYALPSESFNPIPPRYVKNLWKVPYDEPIEKFVRPWTRGIHFWGHMYKKQYAGRGAPPPNSFMGTILTRHGINPDEYPMPAPDA